MKYIVIYGLYDEKENVLKERNREYVSKSTYYRRKKVWKNPPIGVKVVENTIPCHMLLIGFDD